jgi:hypothetical protein
MRVVSAAVLAAVLCLACGVVTPIADNGGHSHASLFSEAVEGTAIRQNQAAKQGVGGGLLPPPMMLLPAGLSIGPLGRPPSFAPSSSSSGRRLLQSFNSWYDFCNTYDGPVCPPCSMSPDDPCASDDVVRERDPMMTRAL